MSPASWPRGASREVAVIGGGPAGLAASHALASLGLPHRVYERARLIESWRHRWDSFRTVTQRWSHRLPGMEVAPGDPEALETAAEVIARLEGYAAEGQTSIELGIEVTALHPVSDGFRLETSGGPVEAPAVIVATGSFRTPRLPPAAAELDRGLTQLAASDYRCPGSLPDGPVLVVGGGQSGGQIAAELRADGRPVYFAIGTARWGPRRYRGRDLMRWLDALGVYHQSIDEHPLGTAARGLANPMVGTAATLSPSMLAARGARVLGRIEGVRHGRVLLAPGLSQAVADGERFAESLRARIDQLVLDRGIELPLEPYEKPAPIDTDAPRELDLARAGVRSIVWATGSTASYGWIHAPAVDASGFPVHVRGVSACPGLYFLGLHWLHTLRSGLLYGMGDDAVHVASHLARWLTNGAAPRGES